MIVLVCVIAINDVTDYIHEANASQTTNHINESHKCIYGKVYLVQHYTSALYCDVPVNWIMLITLLEYTKNSRV